MQRRSVLLLIAFVALAFAAALMRKRADPGSVASRPASSAAAPAGSAASLSTSAVSEAASPSADPAGDPVPPVEPQPPPAGLPSELPSGDPQLPADAPRQVGFGVVLVEYRGAQGASKAARTRSEAAAKAEELRALADKDFASAVKSGDKGSMDNAGSMPRGILEPGPERVLFGLRVGEVGGPVDTPRGYWVVKRLD